jgi:hypothetical protein
MALKNDPASPPVRSPLTWRKCSYVILAVLAIGIALNLWRPIWLAPPRLELSSLLYPLLALAWVPVLAACALLRPVGPRRPVFNLILLGLLATLGASLLAPPGPSGSLFAPLDCQSEPLAGNRVRYTCKADRMVLVTTYVLEGPAGWPFVWLVSTTDVNL